MSPDERRRELRRVREARRPAERVPEQMQPVVREMLVNIRLSMQQAEEVLTAEQRRQVREILRRSVREEVRVRPRTQVRERTRRP